MKKKLEKVVSVYVKQYVADFFLKEKLLCALFNDMGRKLKTVY